MNDKVNQRKSTALFVIAIILFIYFDRVLFPYLNLSPNQNNSEKKEVSASKEVEKPQGQSTLEDTLAVDDNKSTAISNYETLSTFTEEQIKASSIIVENSKFIAELSKIGGRLISFKLKDYQDSPYVNSDLYNMITHRDNFPYPGGIISEDSSDLETEYEILLEKEDVVSELTSSKIEIGESDKSLNIVFQGEISPGKKIVKKYHFTPDTYLFEISATIESGSKLRSPLSLEWSARLPDVESSLFDSNNMSGFVWMIQDVAKRENFSEMVDGNRIKKLSCVNWVGVGDKYFSSAVVSEESFAKANATQVSKNGSVDACVEGNFPQAQLEKINDVALLKFTPSPNPNTLSLKIYSGPKSYSTLTKEGFELKRLVDLGKTGFISAPLLFLLNFFYSFLNNYGLAIVLLTICVKLCLYPLNTAQYRQMKALQALKPEMDKIKETIKDPKQQQVAMMEMYKKKGVNPLGGCMPALVQMPIFIGLYSALMLAVELRHADYGLWVHDLSAPDRLMIAGVGVPALVVLFTVSIMVQQWMTPTNMEPAQKKAMMIMPLVMFFMFMGFPAGLALYWLTNNLISIGQQQAIQYGDKSGKSGLSITIGVAFVVFVLAYLGTLI